jgi:protein TonB
MASPQSMPPPPRRETRPLESLRPRGPDSRAGWIVSGLIHGVLIAALLYVFWKPAPPARVEVFELVSLEAPKLRPLAPKNPEPPPPPEEKVEETRAPEAPKLTSTPKNPVPASKPEPKKPPPPVMDTSKSLPVKEAVRENANLNSVQVENAPVNSPMNFWAGRVKAKIERLWNPPMGIDVEGLAKTVVSFRVSRSGEVSAVEISKSSGNKQLDEEGTRAIKRIENLPPPPVPESFSEDFLQVRYEFIYHGH